MTLKKTIQILFLLLSIFCCAIIQGQTISKKYRLLTYGLQDDTRRNARSIIQEKWRIEFYGVAGCVVSQELEDSVAKENDKTYKLIEAEYGKTWEEQFYKEIEDEYKIEAKIDELVKKQKFIMHKEIVNTLPGAPFPMNPIDNKGNYIVSVSTYNKKWEEQKLYTLKVNFKKNLVTVLNDFTR